MSTRDDPGTSALGAALAIAGSTMLLGAMTLAVIVARWRSGAPEGRVSLLAAVTLAASVLAAAIGRRAATRVAVVCGGVYVASAVTAGAMALVHGLLAAGGVIAMARGADGSRAYWLFIGVSGAVLMGAGVWR